ncbi:MAG TPA: response regulator transcription factor [Thermodesulfobacteriota bacterium]|nr:response regulator transcription factor [Thermodesulfobacteriota bacterium]
MVTKKSIIIIDDHPLFREGIKAIIARDPQFEVVGEAGDGTEGLRLAKKFSPDFFLIDLSLPDKNGISLLRDIKDFLPESHVMIVSMHSKIHYIAEAFQAGAAGYVVKESASDRLLEGLYAIGKGEYFLDSSISPQVVKKLIEAPTKTKITDSAYRALTPREQEVMRLVAEGISKKEIAKMLFISIKTVENHRTNIMKKLGFHSTMDLIRYAAKLGLINLDLWKE